MEKEAWSLSDACVLWDLLIGNDNSSFIAVRSRRTNKVVSRRATFETNDSSRIFALSEILTSLLAQKNGTRTSILFIGWLAENDKLSALALASMISTDGQEENPVFSQDILRILALVASWETAWLGQSIPADSLTRIFEAILEHPNYSLKVAQRILASLNNLSHTSRWLTYDSPALILEAMSETNLFKSKQVSDGLLDLHDKAVRQIVELENTYDRPAIGYIKIKQLQCVLKSIAGNTTVNGTTLVRLITPDIQNIQLSMMALENTNFPEAELNIIVKDFRYPGAIRDFASNLLATH